MNELVVIVEGETEQTFVRDQLSAHLVFHNTTAWPVLPGRQRNRGGVKPWRQAKQDIVRTLKEQRYCTTMFDYYAMPMDWPGRTDAVPQPWNMRSDVVEAALLIDISTAMGNSFNPKFFIPYVQLHEFESLAFSDVTVLASVLAPIGTATEHRMQEHFGNILIQAGHPEAINDGYETCPSRRITNEVPAYKKTLFGPIITHRIGIETLRKQCTHFGAWIARLEQIG